MVEFSSFFHQNLGYFDIRSMDDFGMKILVLAEVASSIAWKPIVGIYSQIAELRAIEELRKLFVISKLRAENTLTNL